MRGQISARPERLVTVRPGRLPESVGDGVVDQGTDDDPDLYEMDPIESSC